ncbi:hypothetical protein O181_126702 [Austropuccinia psidii MF-1]|uniref:Retroviral polymerase SH3-like domain-containing protein n=1 Tax=Austropuccinia psidii MF-1 TaxID=1389203 RepID=A0A9Q3Q8R1_9BASI|nr:hypothetical protein [Austropuccinia psidii MF-1]
MEQQPAYPHKTQYIWFPSHNIQTQKKCSWKLDQRGQEGIMFGYENENTAYQILQLHNRKIIITRHVKFNKKIFPEISNNTSHEEKWKGITEEQSEIATSSITKNNHTIET